MGSLHSMRKGPKKEMSIKSFALFHPQQSFKEQFNYLTPTVVIQIFSFFFWQNRSLFFILYIRSFRPVVCRSLGVRRLCLTFQKGSAPPFEIFYGSANEKRWRTTVIEDWFLEQLEGMNCSADLG